MTTPNVDRRNTLQGLSEIRAYRLSRCVRIIDVAVLGGSSLTRISEVERFPDRARPGEIDQLRATIDRIVAERNRLERSGGAA